MSQMLNRRTMLKMSAVAAAGAGIAALAHTSAAHAAADGDLLVKAGVITDMHRTTQADTDTRKFSASMPKMQAFVNAMNTVKPAFVVELGDFVDTLSAGTDPLKNLAQIETLFTSLPCAHYHVLGNHDFDNLKRNEMLDNIRNTGIPQRQTWYSWDASGVHFIVLDADYTPKGYRPYDMNTPEDTFWTWKDTIIPPQELQWLKEDLQKTALPVILFSHQTLDRVDDQDHNIKNASAVRAILEASGKVLAVISGHDHQGGYANIKGIHYIVMNGNVGVSDTRSWKATSQANGMDPRADNQYAVLEVYACGKGDYRIALNGYGRQPSYTLQRTLA